jgi:hypothetical protein
VQRQIYAALESLAVIKPEEPAAAGGTFGGFGGFGGGGGGFGGQFGAGQLPGGDK